MELSDKMRVSNEIEQLIPSLIELYADPLPPWFIVAICAAFALLGAIGFIFVRQVKYVLGNTPSALLGRTLTLNGAFLIVGIAAVASLLVPQATVFCETVCHLTYAINVYQFFCLIVSSSGGESNLIKTTNHEKVFTMRTQPCCCCCMFMRPTTLTKKKLLRLRLMVLQVPIVQGALLFCLNIINSGNHQLYELAVLYTLPIMMCSVITGQWGVTILVTTLQHFYGELKLKHRFSTIQLIMVAFKLQSVIAIQILRGMNIEAPVEYPVTPRVMMNAILQVVILAEMLLLAWWASRLYKLQPTCVETEPESEA